MMQSSLDFCDYVTYVRNLKVGSHGIFFYRSPHEKHEVVFNFLQAGIEKGEGSVYIASQETSTRIRRHMEDFGLNVKALGKDGVLRVFDYDGWYLVDGEVNAPHTLMLGQRMFDEAMEMGLKGLRGCGETSCFFEHGKEKELVEYELGIGRKLNLPATALCAYDVTHTKSLKDKLFLSLIKAHGPVITHSFAQEVKFEELFPTIMVEALDTVFGNVGRKLILGLLEDRLPPGPDRISGDPSSFIEGLEEVVGSGAHVIAKSVVSEIHSKIGLAPE